jgi:Oxidoreductase family, NAD-binding Rossmann fold
MKTVLLCGCGNIGFRHLQAMVQMPDAVTITIVEPNMAAHARIRAFTEGDTRGHRFTFVEHIPQVRARYDLVVIATSADTRRAAFDGIMAKHDVGVMVLEKVLFQTIADLDAVQDVLTSRGIAAFVNCARRVFPGYRDVLTASGGARPLDLTVTGAGFGLASNGIHLIDLAEYLNNAGLVGLEASGLQPGSVAAKRAGCVEVFGRITGKLSNGARLDITCDDAPDMAMKVAIVGNGYTCAIDELAKTITVDGEVTPFGSKFVSETWEIYHQALTTGTTDLTPYADSARQHRLFLTAILGHMGLAADGTCPIS